MCNAVGWTVEGENFTSRFTNKNVNDNEFRRVRFWLYVFMTDYKLLYDFVIIHRLKNNIKVITELEKLMFNFIF